MPKSRPPQKLRWGLLATGTIAKKFAEGVAASRTGTLQAAGSRDIARARKFADAHDIPTAHGSYDDLLSDPNVDAIYISTPHPAHREWAIRSAEAGKHILCEKPIAVNLLEAREIATAARTHGVLLMESFMYRCHPQTQRICEIVRSGRLGNIQLIEATFGFRSQYNPSSRLWDRALGGGGILDVGCYPMSISRLVAGAALGQSFADPLTIAGTGSLHPESGVDIYAVATLGFPGGIAAQIGCGVGLQLDNTLTIHGTSGRLHAPHPFLAPTESRLEVTDFEVGRTEVLEIEADRGIYALEADAIGDAIADGALETTAMPIDDTLGNLAALDRWRESIGLTYEADG